MTETQKKITQVFNSMRDVVIEKNKRYGDAALTPKKIFSKLEPGEGIKVRIDDKLSRILHNQGEIRKNDAAEFSPHAWGCSSSSGQTQRRGY
jgi:hypothetical protein